MLGFILLIFFYGLLIFAIFGKLNKSKNPFGNINTVTKEGFATTPVMYDQTIEKLADEVISEELKEQGFSIFDSTYEIETKKTIIAGIVGVILFIANMIAIFRISDILAGFLILVTIVPLLIMVFKFNLKKSIYKAFNERENEDMEYVIHSMIQRKTSRVPFILARILLIIVLFVIPYLIAGDEKFIFEKGDGGYVLRYYIGNNIPENVVIPETYKDEPVVGIRGNVFKDLKEVKSIKIPDTVTEIRGKAFMGDSSLESIDLPDKLIYLGGSAFKGCTSLTQVTIPEKVTEIGGNTFEGDLNLIMVILPKEMNKIGAYAFKDCSKLENIGDVTVKEVGAYAFYETMISKIKLAEGADKIHEGAFAGTHITTIQLPTTITKISESAFSNSWLSEIVLNEGLQEISESAFEYTNLKSIVIPDTVTKLSAHVFQGCSSLSSVKLSKNITEIKASAFRSTGITSIDIPEGVTRIGQSAFRDCKKLVTVNVPSTVTTIEDSAFRECKQLNRLEIPRGTKLGEKVFKDSPTTVNYR